jgi:hypothetical protein
MPLYVVVDKGHDKVGNKIDSPEPNVTRGHGRKGIGH